MREEFTRITEAIEDLERDLALAKQQADRVWRSIKNEYPDDAKACAKSLAQTAAFIKADSLSLIVAADGVQHSAQEKLEDLRRCDICGKVMNEGFLIDDNEYFCSEECLHKKYSEEEYLEMYKNDVAYWTEWEE